jgi:hypothetical protein
MQATGTAPTQAYTISYKMLIILILHTTIYKSDLSGTWTTTEHAPCGHARL